MCNCSKVITPKLHYLYSANSYSITYVRIATLNGLLLQGVLMCLQDQCTVTIITIILLHGVCYSVTWWNPTVTNKL